MCSGVATTPPKLLAWRTGGLVAMVCHFGVIPVSILLPQLSFPSSVWGCLLGLLCCCGSCVLDLSSWQAVGLAEGAAEAGSAESSLGLRKGRRSGRDLRQAVLSEPGGGSSATGFAARWNIPSAGASIMVGLPLYLSLNSTPRSDFHVVSASQHDNYSSLQIVLHLK